MQDLPKAADDRAPLRRKLVGLILCFLFLSAGLWVADHQGGRPDPLHRQVFANRAAAALDWFFYPVERNSFMSLTYIDQSLSAVAMSEDGSHLWVAASNGKIIASTDYGDTWSNLTSGVKVDLSAIAMGSDGRCGLVVGADGIILKTEDGGATWAIQPNGISVDLYTVALLDDCRHAWVGGRDIVLFTADGGAHWNPAARAEADEGGYIAAQATRDGRAFLIHQGYGLRMSDDRGATWTAIDSLSSRNFEDLAFSADGKIGWGLDFEGGFSRSTDGGRTWLRKHLLFSTTLPQVAMAGAAVHGILADRDGRVFFTVDGGQNWTEAINPAGGELLDVAISRDGKHGVAVGPGSVITTRDGGRTWRPRMTGQGRIRSIFIAADQKTVWMAGDGPTLMKSEDRGRTWLPQLTADAPWLLGTRSLRGFHMAADGRRGWMAGEGNLFRTWDGGVTWIADPVRQFGGITSYVGFDDDSGWMTGSPVGKLLQLRGDATRQISEQITPFTLDAVALSADRSRIWGVGRGPTLARSEDGGRTFAAVPLPAGKNWLRAVAMLPDGTRGSIVGARGIALFTEDGGSTWTAVDSTAETTLNAVILFADGEGWSVGNRGTLLATADAGRTWRRQPAPFRASITAIALQQGGFGLVGGFARHSAFTEDGGRTWHWLSSYGRDRAPWATAWVAACLLAAVIIGVRRPRRMARN